MKKTEGIREILLTAVFPKRCAVCDDIIKEKTGICSKCREKIRPLGENICRKCGKKVTQEQVYCYDCRRKKHEFERGFAVFEYENIKESLYRFKYAGRAEYAAFYAKAACSRFGKELLAIGADALIPVPLYRAKQIKRGYNQAYEFAGQIGHITGIPVENGLVRRQKNTLPMKTLKGWERQNNLKSAFLIKGNDVKLKTIIIIDDIYTTGATVDAVARVCKEAGIEKIYFLTIAVGSGI